MEFLLLIPILVFAMIFSSIVTLHKDFLHYATIYRTLPFRKYYLCIDQVYSHHWGQSDDGFVWFTESNDFKLLKNHYLHKNLAWTNPYSLYWFIKYRNWFKKNVDIEKIPKYSSTLN